MNTGKTKLMIILIMKTNDQRDYIHHVKTDYQIRKRAEIEAVVLTEEEIKAALFAAKHAKFNRMKIENEK